MNKLWTRKENKPAITKVPCVRVICENESVRRAKGGEYRKRVKGWDNTGEEASEGWEWHAKE